MKKLFPLVMLALISGCSDDGAQQPFDRETDGGVQSGTVQTLCGQRERPDHGRFLHQRAGREKAVPAGSGGLAEPRDGLFDGMVRPVLERRPDAGTPER